tara:strand:+ start:82 stop:393 length:312 start_codon:yes stop_codon:yes gene_type:complete
MIKLKQTKKKITKLLMDNKHLRDNDYKLLANVWHYEMRKAGINPETLTAYGFLKLFTEQKFSHPESVRRSRAKLQEEHPELRGIKYNKRKQNAEKIKNEINNF